MAAVKIKTKQPFVFLSFARDIIVCKSFIVRSEERSCRERV